MFYEPSATRITEQNNSDEVFDLQNCNVSFERNGLCYKLTPFENISSNTPIEFSIIPVVQHSKQLIISVNGTFDNEKNKIIIECQPKFEKAVFIGLLHIVEDTACNFEIKSINEKEESVASFNIFREVGKLMKNIFK